MYKTQLMNRIVAGIGLFALVALCIPFGAWAQSALNVDYTVINPTDDDLYGGSITLAISGGVSPYSVTWCDSSYNDSLLINNLTAGYYNCKVKDAADNEALLSIQLYFVAKWNPEKPYLSLNRLDAESNGWMEFDVTDSLLDMRVGFVFDGFDADSILDVGFDMQDGELKVFMNDSVFLLPSEVNIVANASYKIERIGSYFAFYRNGFKIFGRTGTENAALNSPPVRGGWEDRTTFNYTLIPASVLGSRFSFRTDYNTFYYPYNKCPDDFNWVYTEVYNGYGIPVSATKQFLDHLGRPVQSQEMNVTENRILAAEVKYDVLGRPVLSSLPAPINNREFCYKPNFIAASVDNSLTAYQFEHFDDYSGGDNSNTPLPVSSSGYGDLGWYYSNANTIEPFVAATSYPYKRAEFFPYPDGEAKRASAEGDVLRMGNGHEQRVFTMPEANELEWVFGKDLSYTNNINTTDNFSPTNVVTAFNMGIAAYKSITVDENGAEQVTYSNALGQTIASCLVGQDVCASGIQKARLRMTPGYGAAIHVPAAMLNSTYEMTLTVKARQNAGAVDPANLNIEIIDLNTYKPLAATDFEIDATNASSVVSYMVFDKPVDASTCPIPFACGPYFWLTKNVRLKFTSTYLANHTGSGYYRILINNGSDGFGNMFVDYIEIEHPLNYSNWTINYYDEQTGQLTKSIPPLGIDCDYDPDEAVTITDRDDHIVDVYDAVTPEYLVPSNNNYSEAIVAPTAQHTQRKLVSMHLGPNNTSYNFLNANDENVPVSEGVTENTWCNFLENEENKSAPEIICYTDNVFNPPVINVGASNADPLKDPPTPVEFTPLIRMPIDDGLFLKREVLGPGSHVLDVENRLIVPSSEMPLRDLEAIVTEQIEGATEHRNLLFTNTGNGQANFIAVPNPDFTSIIQGGWGNSDFCTYGQFPCVIGDVNNSNYTNVYTELQSWAQVYHFLHCCNSLHELTDIYNNCIDPLDIINANPWSEGESPYKRVEHLATFYLDVDVIAENTSNSSISRIIKPAKLQISVAKACCLLIWYNCKLTGVEFSDQELNDKNNLRIRVTKVKVGTGSDPNEYLNPTYQVDGAPVSPMPPHLIMDFDADWRYHSLLQFTNIKLAVTTQQDPILEPAHTMAINYLYDGYGQMVATKSPDEGIKEVKYDNEGKPRFTQDAEQKLADKFSYINYDNEDRVIENGEYDYSVSGSTPASSYYFNTNLVIAGVTNTPPSYYIDLDDHLDDKLVGSYAPHFKDVSTLAYDMPVSLPTGLTGYTQRYMGGRVARSSGYSNTYYSYDYNGNPIWTVKSLPIGNKTIDYEYDKLGMARKVSYQKNVEWEQFHHHYSYDRSLRLSKVFTSFDGNLSNASLQARYIYYLHGPVKRVELGNKLQGIDYVYTINGWLKSINNPDMVNQLDPGGDGAWYGEPGTTPVADPEGFAFDVFAENLDYFPGDYTRYGTYVQTFNKTDGYDPFASTTYNNGCSTAGTGGLEWGCPTPNLTTIPARYNGLIQSATWRTLADNDEINPGLHSLSTYTTDPGMRMQLFDYDNQYRLKSAVYGKIAQRGTQNYASHITPHSPAFEPEKDYLVYNLTYNKNGNILTHKRNGNNALYPERDNLTYNYNAGTNQLNYVQDAAPTSGVPSNLYGFLNQSSNNYGYDAIGRIVSDAGASNTTISYHHNQKVEEVKESGNLKMKLYYDEAGNRVKKETYDATGTTLTKITHYVPDGGGSIMAIYEENDPGSSQDLEVEYPVYAGDKTGAWYAHLDWQSAGVYTRTIVKNEFELKDHLGNIRAVIESTKDSKGHPLLVSHNDYYPFGSVMPGPASLNPPGNGSRYGYQGKELLSETGLYDFGLRMYHSDLGKWLSPDPYAQFWSPYTAMGNNPVSIIDPTGGAGYVDKNGDGINDLDAITFYFDGFEISSSLGSNIFYGAMKMIGNAEREKQRKLKNELMAYQMGFKNLNPGIYDFQLADIVVIANRLPSINNTIDEMQGILNRISSWSDLSGDNSTQLAMVGGDGDPRKITSNYDGGTIRLPESTFTTRWRDNESFVPRFAYDVADGFWLFGQQIFMFRRSTLQHIGGGDVNWRDRQVKSLLSLTILAPGPKVSTGCFLPGTPVLMSDGLKNIELIELGDTVLVDFSKVVNDKLTTSTSPQLLELDKEFIDTSKWVALNLTYNTTDSTESDIRLLRPILWLDSFRVKEVGGVYLNIPEIGINAFTKVKDIKPSSVNFQGISDSLGIVSGTFRHQVNQLLYLFFESDTVITTKEHPFWSIDKQTWISAGSLSVSERVKCRNGNEQLLKAQYVNGKFDVYNIEVHKAHNYYVYKELFLVHNAGPCDILFLSSKNTPGVGKLSAWVKTVGTKLVVDVADIAAISQGEGVALPALLSKLQEIAAQKGAAQIEITLTGVVKGAEARYLEFAKQYGFEVTYQKFPGGVKNMILKR